MRLYIIVCKLTTGLRKFLNKDVHVLSGDYEIKPSYHNSESAIIKYRLIVLWIMWKPEVYILMCITDQNMSIKLYRISVLLSGQRFPYNINHAMFLVISSIHIYQSPPFLSGQICLTLRLVFLTWKPFLITLYSTNNPCRLTKASNLHDLCQSTPLELRVQLVPDNLDT